MTSISREDEPTMADAESADVVANKAESLDTVTHTEKNQPSSDSVPSDDAVEGLQMVPDNEEGAGAVSKPKPTKLKNYASKDSGALIMEHSPGSKGSDNLLVDSKDKYIISPCEEKQWVVIGLSEDILVRTIKISSYEKYSRIVREFQVLGSYGFPVDKWMDLGTFTAANMHGEQEFELPRPAFARYLKFKMLNHYGDDYYCTLSHIRVHGSTLMENFHQDLQASTEEVLEMKERMRNPPVVVPVDSMPLTPSDADLPKIPLESELSVETPDISNEGIVKLEANVRYGTIPSDQNLDTAMLAESAEQIRAEQKQKNEGFESRESDQPVLDFNSNEISTSFGSQETTSDGVDNTTENPVKVGGKSIVHDENSPENMEDSEISMESETQERLSHTVESDSDFDAVKEDHVITDSLSVNNNSESIPSNENLAKELNITVTAIRNDEKNESNSIPSNDGIALQKEPISDKKEGNHSQKEAISVQKEPFSTQNDGFFSCQELLSFAEFKEKMLAKVPNKEQTVTIGGQYENIFRTMLNKIKGLEISQSLFGLYVDNLHECYGGVIESIRLQQKREKRMKVLQEEIERLSSHVDQLLVPQLVQPSVENFTTSIYFDQLQQQQYENWHAEKLFLSSAAWFSSLLSLIFFLSLCVRMLMSVCKRQLSTKGHKKLESEVRPTVISSFTSELSDSSNHSVPVCSCSCCQCIEHKYRKISRRKSKLVNQ